MPKAASKPDLTALVVVFFSLVWALLIHSRSYSINDASRMASIESLVHRATWAIDDSAFSFTIDQIKVGEHFYSSKPPLLSFIGAGVYYPLHYGLGLSLQSQGCAPQDGPGYCRAWREAGQADWAYFVLTFLLVGSPATLMLALLYRLARRQGFGNLDSLGLTLALGVGTALLPYSSVFSNHVPAAAALLLAFYILLTRQRPTPLQLGLAGGAATLAACIDLSNAAFLGMLLVYVLLRYRRDVLWFVIGGLGPGLLTLFLDFQIVGNPWPPQMYAQGYDYAGSAFAAHIAGNQAADNVQRYIFNMFVGDNGVLAFFPILLWYLYGLGKALQSNDATTRWLALTATGGSLVYVAYFALSTDNFGGFCYSPRWLLNPVPLLALFSAVNPALYYRRSMLVGLLAFISMLNACQGSLDPWQPAFPPLHISFLSDSESPTAASMSGYDSFYELDPALRKSLGSNRVAVRRFDARAGLVVPPGLGWWFIGPATPLAAPLSPLLKLDAGRPVALQTDLSAAARAWLDAFQTDAYQSDALIPAADQPAQAIILPVTWGGQMTLLGYQWRQTEQQIELITAWRIEAKPPGARKVFAHLLAPGGDIAGQSDGLAADAASLRPGDVLFQVQTIPLHDLAAGDYWLQVGVYDSDTGARLTTPDGNNRVLLTQVTQE